MASRLLCLTSPSLSPLNPAHKDIADAWNRKGRRVGFSTTLSPTHLSSYKGSWRSVALQPVVPLSAPTTREVSKVVPVGGTREYGFYEVEFKVRAYELDQYRVVHNSCYPSYCQQARQEFLESMGVFPDETAQTGKAVALAESNLKYLAPLRSGDRFVVRVRVSGLTAARLLFESCIFKLPHFEPILQEKATIVWLDESYRPTRIPPDVRSKLLQHLPGREESMN